MGNSMIFRDLTIRQKLALLTLTSSVFAVILACVGFAFYERQRFHTDIANELAMLTDTLGEQHSRLSGLQRSEDGAGDTVGVADRTSFVSSLPVRPSWAHFCRVPPRRPAAWIRDAVVEA